MTVRIKISMSFQFSKLHRNYFNFSQIELVMGNMLFGLDWDCMNDILDDNALTTRVIHSSTYFNRMMAPMDNGLMLWKLFPTPLYLKLKKCSEDVDL